MVDLGHNLGLTLVAEGVETETALIAPADLGCDIAQDCYLSRPIPADTFETCYTDRLAVTR